MDISNKIGNFIDSINQTVTTTQSLIEKGNVNGKTVQPKTEGATSVGGKIKALWKNIVALPSSIKRRVIQRKSNFENVNTQSQTVQRAGSKSSNVSVNQSVETEPKQPLNLEKGKKDIGPRPQSPAPYPPKKKINLNDKSQNVESKTSETKTTIATPKSSGRRNSLGQLPPPLPPRRNKTESAKKDIGTEQGKGTIGQENKSENVPTQKHEPEMQKTTIPTPPNVPPPPPIVSGNKPKPVTTEQTQSNQTSLLDQLKNFDKDKLKSVDVSQKNTEGLSKNQGNDLESLLINAMMNRQEEINEDWGNMNDDDWDDKYDTQSENSVPGEPQKEETEIPTQSHISTPPLQNSSINTNNPASTSQTKSEEKLIENEKSIKEDPARIEEERKIAEETNNALRKAMAARRTDIAGNEEEEEEEEEVDWD